MVSKVAIIAIVAILAVPILLGYALNVEQVTETEYKTTGDGVNVTPLLTSGTAYNYAQANTYQLNTNFKEMQAPIIPIYQKYTTAHTSAKLSFEKKIDGYIPAGPYVMSSYTAWAWQFDYNSDVGYLIATLTDTNSQSQSYNKIHTLYVDYNTNTVYMSYYTNGYNVANLPYTFNNIYSVSFSATGSYHADATYQWYDRPVDNKYIDFSAGFRLSSGSSAFSTIDLPNFTKSTIFTIDLNSITDNNYTLKIGAGGHNSGSNYNFTQPYNLTKTTTAGVVSWTLTSVTDPSKTWDLYYDPATPHNTYQIYWDWIYDYSGEVYHDNGLDMDFHDMYYNSHREFRYVGNWPDAIGEANVYWKVTDDIVTYTPMPMPYELPDYVPSDYTDYNFSHIYLTYTGSTPTMRVDAASFRAFEYQVIEGRTLDAASFKTNPSTTIDNINAYGPSFTFGGNTYNVKKGNITMGGHEIPVKGLVLSSVPNPEGGYDNKIGNTVISTTEDPSTITFNGKWSASITVTAQEEYEITKTEWKAGDFAWNGIDKNFIMAGLLASLGAFVGVGIYARRTKSTVWPLLIVCGGAALLFFVML